MIDQAIDLVDIKVSFCYSKFAGFDMNSIQFLANSDAMKHKKRVDPNRDLYRPLLIDIINPNHELVRLEKLLDWDFFEREWNGFFPSTTGRPATAPRLVADRSILVGSLAEADR